MFLPTEKQTTYFFVQVMAGDQVSVSSFGFYNTAVQPSGGVDYLTPLISALTGSVVGTSMGKLGAVQATTVNSTLTANVPSFFVTEIIALHSPRLI